MATRSLGSLTLDLVLKMGGFTAGMDKAARDTDKRLTEMERRAYKFGQTIGQGLKLAVGALATGVGLAANQIRQAINNMDELSKSAQRVSLPTEQFSALVYAGKLADVEIGTLQTSLGRLTKAQADSLKSTSEQGRVFKALGISVKDASGNLRNSYDVFLDFADAFKRQEGSPEIVAAGLKIFGRSFQELIPLIKDGSQGLRDASDEAAKFGQVISTETGRQAEAFNDNLSRLQMLVSGLANSVAAELLPDMKRLTDEWVNTAKEGDNLASTAKDIADGIRSLVSWMQEASRVGASFRMSIEGWTTQLFAASDAAAGVLTLDPGRLQNALGEWRKAGIKAVGAAFLGVEEAKKASPLVNIIDPSDLLAEDRRNEAQRQAAALADNRLRDLALGDAPKAPKKPSSQKSDEQKEAERLQETYKQLIASLQERTALIGKEGEAAKVSYDAQFGALQNLTQVEKDRVIALAEKYDADTKAFRVAEDLRKEEERGIENAVRIRDDYLFEIELLGKTVEEQERLIVARQLGASAASEQGKKAIEALRDYQKAAKETAEQLATLDTFRDGFANFFEDVISGTRSIKEAFRDMISDIAMQILRAQAQRWAEQLFGQTGSSGQGSSTNGWVSLITSIAGAFSNGGGRAAGGGISPNTMYRVNESGLEMATVGGRDYLLTGSRGGSVTPASSVGGSPVVNNFAFAAPTSMKTQTQVASRVGYEIRRSQRFGA